MAERDDRLKDSNGQGQADAAELQRRLNATRESITQTVAELRSTMNNEYQSTKERAVQSIDWRIQMRKYPLAACVGALAVGFLAGRAMGHARDEDEDYGYESDNQYSQFSGNSLSASPQGSQRHLISPEVKRRAGQRVESVLTTVADNFLNELSRVGRDVLVPTVIGALTSKLHDVTSQQHQAGAFNTGTQNVGGSGSFGSGQTNPSSGGYSGRAL